MNNHVLIIGAGVIGLMSALECRKAGLSVTLLDMSASGQEASWAGGGILSPLYPWQENPAIDRLHRWSAQQYPLLASELLDSTGIDIEWYKSGLLITDIDQNISIENKLIAREIKFKWLDKDELSQSHPGFKLPQQPALLLPEIAQIRNPRLLNALKKRLQQEKVNILEHHKVIKYNFDKSQARIDSVQTPHGHISADTVILAAGAWSQQLWPQSNSNLELRVFPVKGQMLLLDASIGTVPSIILNNNQYIIPRKDGQLLVGSTVEQNSFNKVTTVAARRQLKQFFDQLYPALCHLTVLKHWAGIRPGSNGIPVISKHPEIENLFVNSGHYRNGLNLAPASARLIVDMITGREPIVSSQPFGI